MKNYAPENASFLFPFQFNSKLLKADLDLCAKFNFLKNYVPTNYNGKNYILPLRSIRGSLDNPVALPNCADTYMDTPALKKCLYFQEVINTFLCKKETVRLMNLPPGAEVNTHTDYKCGYEDGIFRVHIPIITNEDVHFILNSQILKMRVGEVWYTNVNLPHSVTNKGNTNRVHLVLDCIRNEWSDDLFKSVGFDFEKEQQVENKLDQHTLNRIIEELEIKNSPDSKAILDQVKRENGIS